MAAKIQGDDGDAISEINIVPFVDIILVVLIIFMIATPFIVKPSINVNLPKAASGEETKPSQLNISISADGGIYLNGQPSSSDAVAAFAKESFAKSPETQAIIAADKDVPHGQVISVLDVIKGTGITRFAITIDKK